MRPHDKPTPCHDPEAPCCPEVPELRRLRYFYGQMLDSQDFRDEQDYFREKLKLAHRCLHGHGVLCGLRVVPEPREEPCDPATDRKRRELERRLDDLERECAELEEKVEAAQTARTSGSTPAKERDAPGRRLAGCRGKEEEVRRLLDELCPPGEDDERRPARVVVECGVAIDCQGNEIILRWPVEIDLWQALSAADRRRVRDSRKPTEERDEKSYGEPDPGATLYVSLCFCELPVKPVRPVSSGRCAPPEGCRHAQVQDSFRIVVSPDAPPADTRCEPCCCPCGEPCLLLARIDGFVPGRPLAAEQVHNGVRRRFGLYDWTTVTGIGWVHGGGYDDAGAAHVLGRAWRERGNRGKGKPKSGRRKVQDYQEETEYGEPDEEGEEARPTGLEIRFSRPVRTATLDPGVVVVTVYEGYAGGTGKSSGIYHVTGELALPDEPSTDRVVWRQTSDDKFHEGDMVLLQVKAGFILDECCRPVDGEHVGGRVPLLAEYAGDHHPEPEIGACDEPPDHPGPWTSGNGRGGGTFESWIFITY